MNQMISVASDFQYAVNIGFDLNNDEKLKNFIPTKAALDLLKDILESTEMNSTERSRVLIGAYGKGKSHIVLMILSVLMKRDFSLLEKVMPKLDNNPRLSQLINNYYDSANKILPVLITGSQTSLNQAFLVALQRTLSENNLLDVMPDTNYEAAVSVIKRWKKDFPDTYNQLQDIIEEPIYSFISKLENYNIAAYERFENVYPILTAGSVFNPFLGFDVVDLYEQVSKSLRSKGFSGVYVVYDEFSKFLESNIESASLSDTKMLQDFAEKCNRSGSLQMHLMLICHKEISNYIDKLPKQKVDGWRGVSERFKHVRFQNDFSQTYEIISAVICKKEPEWKVFKNQHKNEFLETKKRYEKHPIFSGYKDDIDLAIWECYPLSPLSIFILPRLSEKVAQNERTLFTFLSAKGDSTFSEFLMNTSDSAYSLITPDALYDYFASSLRKEAYASYIHDIYLLTENILAKPSITKLESKLVKTLSLIYILEQFEHLSPTREELISAYISSYSIGDLDSAINDLIEKEYVVYQKQSNNYLRLKQSSGINIKQKIIDYSLLKSEKISLGEILSRNNNDAFLYPARYNDEREMTRFFVFDFIEESTISENFDWSAYLNEKQSDGVVCAILPSSNRAISELKKRILKISANCPQIIFVLPKKHSEISGTVKEYNAVMNLRELAIDDPILFDEYDVIYEDYKEVVSDFIAMYTRPERFASTYIYDGKICDIYRKSSLTELASTICDSVFCDTPIINNEIINKNDITSVARNSRSKILAALLRTELEHGLGLSGTGQEVSIMRSTLIRTGIWTDNPFPSINLHPTDKYMSNLLSVIETFVIQSRHEPLSFATLYEMLTSARYHIGLRKGLIPIFLAAVLHNYKQQVIVSDNVSQIPLTAEVLIQINANPSAFKISCVDWTPDREAFIEGLTTIFNDYVIEAEKKASYYDYVANAMKRWFLSLPKYVKDSKKTVDGEAIDSRYYAMSKLLKSNLNSYDLLFKLIPKEFGYDDLNSKILNDIKESKQFYDNMLEGLTLELIDIVKNEFALSNNLNQLKQMSLASVIADWCDSLDPSVFEQLFQNGTHRCLELFQTSKNNEQFFIEKLARLATDLRIEDWDETSIDKFVEIIRMYKKTAIEYIGDSSIAETNEINNYQITFVDDNGIAVTKRFDKVEYSKRGNLLLNQITASLDAMGQSITEQEKRQILVEVLKKYC